MNWIEVDFNGRRLRVPAVKSQGKLWFHWEGEAHAIDVGGGRRAGGAGQKATPGVLAAPMPGKVTKVFARKGDKVARGQALVVMEAMKMEYTLEADHDGKVTEVGAEMGAQVALGQVLVRVGDA